jgi:hypothetical protein
MQATLEDNMWYQTLTSPQSEAGRQTSMVGMITLGSKVQPNTYYHMHASRG